MKFGRNAPLSLDITVSRWQPCRHFTQKSAAIWQDCLAHMQQFHDSSHGVAAAAGYR